MGGRQMLLQKSEARNTTAVSTRGHVMILVAEDDGALGGIFTERSFSGGKASRGGAELSFNPMGSSFVKP